MPLELADQVIPKNIKLSICNAIMDAPAYLMYSSMHVTLYKNMQGYEENLDFKLIFDIVK